MASLVERIGALKGTETADAIDLAHRTYRDRLSDHRRVGLALVETAATVCRGHPGLVGLGAGVLVEQLLVRARDQHEAEAAGNATAAPVDPFARAGAAPSATWTAPSGGGLRTAASLRLAELRPGQVAREVFVALLFLKLAATGARVFRHKHQDEAWFAPAARIRLFSASLAVYNLVAAARGSRASAWRNGAAVFFGTDALKPLLNPSRRRRTLKRPAKA